MECSYEQGGEDLDAQTNSFGIWDLILYPKLVNRDSRATHINLFQIYTNFQVVESDFIMFRYELKSGFERPSFLLLH